MKNVRKRYLIIVLAILLGVSAVMMAPQLTLHAYASEEASPGQALITSGVDVRLNATGSTNSELVKGADGKTRLYRNGEVWTAYTGLYETPNGKFYYIRSGVWQDGYKGLYEHSKNGKFYYLLGGYGNRAITASTSIQRMADSII